VRIERRKCDSTLWAGLSISWSLTGRPPSPLPIETLDRSLWRRPGTCLLLQVSGEMALTSYSLLGRLHSLLVAPKSWAVERTVFPAGATSCRPTLVAPAPEERYIQRRVTSDYITHLAFFLHHFVRNGFPSLGETGTALAMIDSGFYRLGGFVLTEPVWLDTFVTRQPL
jgi:hypothetical protein